MAIFEYLMVLVSIIMGLGMTQTLRGLSKIVRSDKPYLAVTFWAWLLLYLYVQVWWALWDLNAVETWNQLYFTMIVVIPCCMFGATELLMPIGATAETDWEVHYFKVRRWFYAMMVVFVCIALVETRLLLGVPLTHPYRIVQVMALGLMIVGWISDRPRLQPWLPAGMLTVLVIGQAMFRLFPGLS